MSKICKARKKDRGRCRANAQPANELCIFHDPSKAMDADRARKDGGRNRMFRAVPLGADTPDYPLGNPIEVSNVLAASINQLLRGNSNRKSAMRLGISQRCC